MATTDNTAKYDLAYINEFYPYLPDNITKSVSKRGMLKLASLGLLQRDRFAEKAMANASNGKYECISEDKKDFTDGSDMKTATVYYEKTGSTVRISHIANKEGPLRVMVYDPKQERFKYYFIYDYDHVRKINRIDFTIGANSKYTNGDCGIEVNSFQELANIESDYF